MSFLDVWRSTQANTKTVTKEEVVWESFSEEEPAPAPKPKAPKASFPPPAKKKGAASKPGQGNIMSFFGKK